jgi:peptidyl-prolyl cis-trans isomerase B (cyclophilin B)
MDTNLGKVKIELFEDKAPGTVKNFLAYVDDKFYDDTVFHRVIPDFMVQGGGFSSGMSRAKSGREFQGLQKKAKPPIKNESDNGLKNEKGTLAMARTPDPDSATAQFFVNTKDNAFLDKANARDGAGYCVFGKVIEGMDVIDKIRNVKTHTIERGLSDVPDEDVVIKSIRRVSK